MRSILIVEDDFSIANLIKTYVEMVGFETCIAPDGECALQILSEEKFNLVILDLMLPAVSGEDILLQINKIGTPTIVLSAKSSLSEKVKLLRAGADDYITKPFESADLIARIEAVLRRYERESAYIEFKDIQIDIQRHVVKKLGKAVDLTPKEYDLFLYLVQNKETALSRNKLIDAVWQGHTLSDRRTVDVHIQRLRKKLQLANEIKAITKYGYILQEKNEKL